MAKVNKKFISKLKKYPGKGGWTYAVWSKSIEFFKTRGLVKIRGTIDGHPFRSSFMAMGNGKQMLPVKKEIRKIIGKEAGDTVTVYIKDRL